MLNLYDKLVMDSAQADAAAREARRAFKHVGEFTESKTPVVILFRTVPDEPENALIVAPKFLSADYQDNLQKAVESAEGQASYEFGEYLQRQSFADGVNMLEYLHSHNNIKKIPSKDITVTFGATAAGRIALDDLNKQIAKDKGVNISELHTSAGKPSVTADATATPKE